MELGIKKLLQKYEEYKEKKPERDAARLEKLKYRRQLAEQRAAIQSVRNKTRSQRLNLDERRIKVQTQRSKLMNKDMEGIPTFAGFPSLGSSVTKEEEKKEPKKAKRYRKRKKRRRSK